MTRLTEYDRALVDDARRVGAELRASPDRDRQTAGWLLEEMTGIIGRLDGAEEDGDG